MPVETFDDLRGLPGWNDLPASPNTSLNIAFGCMLLGGTSLAVWFALSSVGSESTATGVIGGLSCLGAPSFAFGALAGLMSYSGRNKAIATWTRRCQLARRYGGFHAADNIQRGVLWQGEPEQALIASLGRPVARDEKVTRRSIRYVYKYHMTGKNRYGLRVTVENGVVTGWDAKGG